MCVSPSFTPPGAEVGEFAARDAVALAAARQLQAVVAEAREAAVLEGAVAEPFAPHGAGHADGRLGEAADLGLRVGPDVGLVLAAWKPAGKYHSVCEKVSPRRTTRSTNCPASGRPSKRSTCCEHGGDGLDVGKLFPGTWQVVERPGSRVEIPFSRLVQELEGAFDVVEVARRKLEDRALAEADDALLFVHAQ